VQRTIEAPDKEWLKEDEVATWLGIGTKAFALLLENQVVPQGRWFGRGEVFWHWRTVVAISILLESGHFARSDAEKKSAEKGPEQPAGPRK
jgi:hypothetical protein